MMLQNQEMEAAEKKENPKGSPEEKEKEKPKVDNIAKKDGPLRQKQVRAVVMGNSFNSTRENLLLGVVPKSESGSGEKENKVVPVNTDANCYFGQVTDANCPFEKVGPDAFGTAAKNANSMSKLDEGIRPQPLFQSPGGYGVRSPSESFSYGGRDSLSPGRMGDDILAPTNSTQEGSTNRFLFNLAAQSKQARSKGMAGILAAPKDKPV